MSDVAKYCIPGNTSYQGSVVTRIPGMTYQRLEPSNNIPADPAGAEARLTNRFIENSEHVPIKGQQFRYFFSYYTSSGLITGITGQDTELSFNGGSFSDATNEAVEIGSTGGVYIDLTAEEMNYNSVTIKSTVTNPNAIPVIVTLYPR